MVYVDVYKVIMDKINNVAESAEQIEHFPRKKSINRSTVIVNASKNYPTDRDRPAQSM